MKSKKRENSSCCWKERRARGEGLYLGVSVSLSWLFVAAECVGAAVEGERKRGERKREDERAVITEEQQDERGTSSTAEIQGSCLLAETDQV